MHYKIIVPEKVISLEIYFLNRKLVDELLLEAKFDREKLVNLKNYIRALNRTVSLCEKRNYISMSRDIDKNSLFSVNCKVSSSHPRRIQTSFYFSKYLKNFNPLLKPEYSGVILRL